MRVDDQQHAHVELIVSQGSKLMLRTFQQNLQSMLQEHAAAGRLQSGLTIRRAIELLEAQIRETMPVITSRVGAVSQTPEAFAAIEAAIEQLVETLEGELPAVVRIADGKQPGQAVNASVQTAVNQLMSDWRENLALEVQLARASFLAARPEAEPHPSAPPTVAPASGPSFTPNPAIVGYTVDRGRRAAAFWDDLWIHIAVEIFAGRINPESQQAIQEAMLQWTSDRGFSLGESTARPRARKLATAFRKELNIMDK